jgi:hypothetical protein
MVLYEHVPVLNMERLQLTQMWKLSSGDNGMAIMYGLFKRNIRQNVTYR